jgi:predicted nuclease with TOPRIM domain
METQNHDTEPKSNNNKGLLIGLGVFLIISLATNIYLWKQSAEKEIVYQTKVDSLYIVRDNLSADLSNTNTDLNKYKGINDSLDRVVEEGNSKIAEQEAKINELKRKANKSEGDRKKLQEEVTKLNKLKEEYLERIDQLMTENQVLKTQNQDLTGTVSHLTEEKSGLEKKVNAAAAIKTEYVKATAYKKRLLTNKLVETSMANKTTKLHVCFTVLENPLAQVGDKVAYVRIIAPDGKSTLGDKSKGSGTFKTSDNEEIQVTFTIPFSYKNQKQELCSDYEDEKHLLTDGNYKVEVYIDGTLSSTSVFSLK